jgi:hypothetical protein
VTTPESAQKSLYYQVKAFLGAFRSRSERVDASSSIVEAGASKADFSNLLVDFSQGITLCACYLLLRINAQGKLG